MTDNPWHDLNRRVKAMHTLWQRAVADLTIDHVNHWERDGVLPIAFSLMHYVNGEDRSVAERLLDRPSLWESEGWEVRIGGNASPMVRGTPMSAAELVRFDDVDAWREYQTAVFARTELALASTPRERFSEVLFDRVPVSLEGAFIALVAGDGPVRLGDQMDAFLYQHGCRHLGELEHARSLVGLGGVS